MKKIVMVGCVLLIAVVVVAVVFFVFGTGGTYTIGELSQRDDLEPVEQTLDNTYFEISKDIQLHYFSQGEGKKVLIIHGGPGMPYSEPWPGLEEVEGYEFIYYDQRGCGQSTRPIDTFETSNYYENTKTLETSLGLTAQIGDIERIRRILNEDKLILIGHSYGGFLASLYAAEFPEQVEKLILVAPAPLIKMPMAAESLFDSIERKLPESEKNNYELFIKRYFDYKNIFKNSDEDLVSLNNELGKYYMMALEDEQVSLPVNGKSGGWMIQALYLSAGQKYDYTEAISEAQVPTLIVHSGNDMVQTKEASEVYLNVFPHSEFVTIEDAGHMSFYDQPEIFAKHLKAFLSK